MSKSRITKPVTKTVVLGSKQYGNVLTVTATGSVMPVMAGATAIYAASAAADLTNDGSVVGGTGGIGVDLSAGGTITSAGLIGGGVAASPSDAGGDAIDTGGGQITNTGTIAGGNVGHSLAAGGVAGIGVNASAPVTVTNTGVILGGYGGSAQGGAGVLLTAGGTVTNGGDIKGGGSYAYRASSTSGVGVDLANGGKLSNTGTIQGGSATYGPYPHGGGGAGVTAQAATIMNSGVIGGGFGYDTGGNGVTLDGGKLSNPGQITGGGSADPGAGVYATGSASVTNTGTITGGYSVIYYQDAVSHRAYIGYGERGGPAPHPVSTIGEGVGVSLSGASTLINHATIAGGAGAATFGIYSQDGRDGGNGVNISGAAAINDGVILGGNGGLTTYGNKLGYGGAGGAASYILAGGTLTNAGTLIGGNGGDATRGTGGNGGDGGAGVFLSGGTLIDSGSITGGTGGTGITKSGANGDAVQFGSSAGTLQITKAATFGGAVVANPRVDDVLVLAQGGAGTLTGLGSKFAYFTTVAENAGAAWNLAGVNTLGFGTQLLDGGSLSVTGTLTDTGDATISSTGKLLAAGGGFVHLADVSLAGGTLATDATSSLAIGRGMTHPPAGILKIEAAFSVVGDGTIGSNGTAGIDDNGTIAANGGTLTLDSSTSGTGAPAIDSGSALSVIGNVATASLTFMQGGGETLFVSAAATIATPISGFGAGDLIDVAKSAQSLAFQNGTLTLLQNGNVVESLTFNGNYTLSDFALKPDGNGGSDIAYAGNDASWPAAIHADAGGAAAWARWAENDTGDGVRVMAHNAWPDGH